MDEVMADDFVDVDEDDAEEDVIVVDIVVVVVVVVDVIVVVVADVVLRVSTKNLRNLLTLSLASSGEVAVSRAASWAKAEARRDRSSSLISDASRSAAVQRDFVGSCCCCS